MSDDGDVDVESAEDVPEIGGEATATTANSSRLYGGNHDRRAHHNALERRRRDHIKDSFSGLRDCIPSLVGEKVSRAHVLNKATEYIRHMQKSGSTREEDICELARKNEVLEEQVRALEDARSRGVKVNAEEILSSVAARVQSRQSQEMITQQQHQAKVNSKSKSSSGGGVMASSKSTATITATTTSVPVRPHTTQAAGGTGNNKILTRATAAGKITDVGTSTSSSTSSTSTGTSQAVPVSTNMSLLASKLKNPQSFLAALQKAGNLQNIKNLAACVLASPLMKGAAATQAQAKVTQASSPTIPRGIVTATTVPKGGGVAIPAVKPSASVHVTGNTVNIQQPTASPAPTQPVPAAAAAATSNSSSSVTLAALVEEALKKTDTGGSAGAGGSLAASSSNPPANLLTPMQAPPISPSPVSTVASSPNLPDTSQLASSLLEVHNLLQQQQQQQQQQQVRSPAPPPPVMPRPPVPALDEDVGVGQGLAGLSPELLAQVSSILNLPPLSGSGGMAPPAGSPVGNVSLGTQGAIQSATGDLKRSSPSGSFDNPPASKRPNIDQ